MWNSTHDYWRQKPVVPNVLIAPFHGQTFRLGKKELPSRRVADADKARKGGVFIALTASTISSGIAEFLHLAHPGFVSQTDE